MTALFGISANQLTSKPPRDALEFARKLLIGAYTVDDNEEMKTAFRTKMLSQLQRQRSNLRRTTTKEATREPTHEELDFVVSIWEQYNGN